MNQIKHHLQMQPLLSDLEPKLIDVIASCGQMKQFNKNDIIFRQHGDANYFYIITHGLVSLAVNTTGRQHQSLQTIGANDLLGWSWLCPPYQWHFDAVALEATEVVCFDADCLRNKMEENPHLGYQLSKRFIQLIASRLQASRFQLLDVYR